MRCLREVQTISQSPHILPMPSLTRLTTGGVLNPTKNTTNTSHNELLHQEPLQPPLEPRDYIEASTCEDFIEVIRIGRCCGNAPPRPWRRGRGLARLGKCARDGPRLREV